MELRKLVSKDIFPMCGILRKIGIKELKTVIKESVSDGKKTTAEALGLDLILDVAELIISNLPSCEKEIYSFLESVIVTDADSRKALRQELENMPIDEFAELIMDIIRKEEFRDFFRVALKSSK